MSTERPATEEERIEAFLGGEAFAVVGASKDRSKYGNRVLRTYLEHGRRVHPVHPKATEIEGLAVFADVTDLPPEVHGVSVVTPPAISERVVEALLGTPIRHLWLQPGAESDRAVARAEQAGLVVVAGGPCVMVELRRRG